MKIIVFEQNYGKHHTESIEIHAAEPNFAQLQLEAINQCDRTIVYWTQFIYMYVKIPVRQIKCLLISNLKRERTTTEQDYVKLQQGAVKFAGAKLDYIEI